MPTVGFQCLSCYEVYASEKAIRNHVKRFIGCLGSGYTDISNNVIDNEVPLFAEDYSGPGDTPEASGLETSPTVSFSPPVAVLPLAGGDPVVEEDNAAEEVESLQFTENEPFDDNGVQGELGLCTFNSSLFQALGSGVGEA